MSTHRRLVRVTQADIDAGTRLSAGSCPVALATYRTFRVFVTVSPRRIAIRHPGWGPHLPRVTFVPLSQRAAEWVQAFDHPELGKAAEPFAFYVNWPDEYQKGLQA